VVSSAEMVVIEVPVVLVAEMVPMGKYRLTMTAVICLYAVIMVIPTFITLFSNDFLLFRNRIFNSMIVVTNPNRYSSFVKIISVIVVGGGVVRPSC